MLTTKIARAVTAMGAATLVVTGAAGTASAQELAPDSLESSIPTDVIDSVVDTSVALSAAPWALSAIGGSIVFCLIDGCADDNT